MTHEEAQRIRMVGWVFALGVALLLGAVVLGIMEGGISSKTRMQLLVGGTVAGGLASLILYNWWASMTSVDRTVYIGVAMASSAGVALALLGPRTGGMVGIGVPATVMLVRAFLGLSRR